MQAVEIRLEEALDNLKEAVEFYLDNAITLGIIKDVDTAFTSTHKIASTFDVTKPRNELRGILGSLFWLQGANPPIYLMNIFACISFVLTSSSVKPACHI